MIESMLILVGVVILAFLSLVGVAILGVLGSALSTLLRHRHDPVENPPVA